MGGKQIKKQKYKKMCRGKTLVLLDNCFNICMNSLTFWHPSFTFKFYQTLYVKYEKYKNQKKIAL
jgi:hypothetical protein